MAKDGEAMERLLGVMRKLRAPDGCPWDREQSHESLKSDLIEEAYEVIDAIESGNASHLEEELGDLLLQVVFHSQISAEAGEFEFHQVANGISDKLVRRHPHVFGEVQVADSGEVLQNWDAIKKVEKQGEGEAPASIVAGIPKHLPALQKAHQIQKRAARAGFDWAHIDDVFDKLHEEIEEVKEAIGRNHEEDIRDEIGDLLFSVVNVSRFLGHNPEELLNHNIKKFVRRFHRVEDQVHATGKEFKQFTLEELDAFWDEAKREET
ncbi:nucleoside triphosphate pyrophosphohydrolase [Pontiella sulfatireligans]|uniref:Nucleoside triphosphate pyrophosphohydrolase n=1 Tax=Pontiella sulfatireligans TaxID=2750658 RepID=A0A6C2UCY8_9BACT|nr:nucleoside triphosphate pyrophosphohydrolase [Pontiella sulfatireligans]VGO17985.1 Nucleoside triphosphate pyrophosphohydrolase [Pontiella sulfatireligans]